jgi:hypothetical protein
MDRPQQRIAEEMQKAVGYDELNEKMRKLHND